MAVASVLVGFASLIVGMIAVPTAASAAPSPGYTVEGPITQDQARQIMLESLNLQRMVRNLPPVTLAANHTTAQCVSNTGRMVHTPSSCGPYTGTFGEVLAGGAADHMELWNNSTGHRDILMRSDIQSVRVGVPVCGFPNSRAANQWQMGTIQPERGSLAYNRNEPKSQAGAYVYPDRYVVCRNGQLTSMISNAPGTSQIPVIGAASSSSGCAIQSPTSTFASQMSSGDWTTGSIWRLYQAYFLRQPDNPGFNYWLNKSWDMRKIASFFSESPEFQQRYGSLSNAQFVSLVYGNVMCRGGELSGFQYWLWRLDGGLSRGEMMLLFSDSPEYKQITRSS